MWVYLVSSDINIFPLSKNMGEIMVIEVLCQSQNLLLALPSWYYTLQLYAWEPKYHHK
jgi:hypothetical protein